MVKLVIQTYTFAGVFLLALHAGQDQAYIPSMEFELNSFQIKTTYLDPTSIGVYTNEPRIVIFKCVIKNGSGRRAEFNPEDLQLAIGHTQPLRPATVSEVIEEINRIQKIPDICRIFKFIGSQSSTFHPNKFEANVAKLRKKLISRQLTNTGLNPRKKTKGFIYYVIPEITTSINWCEFQFLDNDIQALETKGTHVYTSNVQTGFKERFVRLFNEFILGEPPPINKSYALLIGLGDYVHLDKLDSPPLDVDKMSDYLRSQGFDEIISVWDETVTPEYFVMPQQYFTEKLGEHDRLVFYYSGHGVCHRIDGKMRGFLPLINETAIGHSNSIAMDSIIKWLRQLKTKHLLIILDCCFSGMAIDGFEVKAPPSGETINTKDILFDLAHYNAKYLVMAGRRDEVSIGGRQWNGSLFTEMLVRGLKKEADENNDKVISLFELYNWLKPAVWYEAKKVNKKLHPDLVDIDRPRSEGEFLFIAE